MKQAIDQKKDAQLKEALSFYLDQVNKKELAIFIGSAMKEILSANLDEEKKRMTLLVLCDFVELLGCTSESDISAKLAEIFFCYDQDEVESAIRNGFSAFFSGDIEWVESYQDAAFQSRRWLMKLCQICPKCYYSHQNETLIKK